MRKMPESRYNFGDPRRLFQLWKELTGEDLLDHLLEKKSVQLNPSRNDSDGTQIHLVNDKKTREKRDE